MLPSAISSLTHGDLGDEAEVARHQPVCGVGILMLAPALRQHELFFRRKQRKLADFREIAVQRGFAAEGGNGGWEFGFGHDRDFRWRQGFCGKFSEARTIQTASASMSS